MNMPKLRTPMIAAGALGLIIFGLITAILDQRLADSGLSSQIAEHKQALSRMAQDSTNQKALVGDYQKLSSRLGARYRQVSWGKQMPFMLNQITGIMRNRGLKVETLRPDPITSANGVSRLPLRIGFKAGLSDLARVVQDMEKTLPLLYIETLNIRAQTGNMESLQADMTVSSFAISDEAAPEVQLPPISPSRHAPVAKSIAAKSVPDANPHRGEK